MKLKKILSMVLAFAMVLSTMSFTVLAEETADDGLSAVVLNAQSVTGTVNFEPITGDSISYVLGRLDIASNIFASAGGLSEVEITLNEDVVEEEIVMLKYNTVINGNGNSVTSTANRVFRVVNSNVDVTLNNVNMVSDAIRVGTSDIRGISIDELSGVELTLNDCSVDFTDASASDWSYAVNQSGANSNGNTININGGSYEGANVINVWGNNHIINVEGATLTSLYLDSETYYGYCVAFEGDNAKATIKDTIFEGDNAVVMGSKQASCTFESINNTDNTKIYVTESNAVAEVNGTAYETFEDVLNAVKSSTGNEITLLADVSASGQNALDALTGDTLDLNGNTLTVEGNSYFKDGTTTFTNGNIVVNGFASDAFFCGYTAGATIVFDDVAVTGDNYKTGCAVFNANLGKIDIKNSEITLSGDTTGGVIYGGAATIENTAVTAVNVCRGITNSVATITGSDFTFDGGETGFNNSTVTVDNSDVAIKNATKRAVRLGNNTLALQNGATLETENCAEDIVSYNHNSKPVINVDASSTLDAVVDILPEILAGAVAVTTYDELIAALAEDNANVIMMNDITATATQATGYGKAGIVVGKGDVLNGNGHKLTINGANDTWDCAVAMTGGNVKELTVAGAMRGIFMPGADDDVVIDGVVFENVIYTFNSDAGSKDHTVSIKNTVLNGWTSYSNVHGSVTFDGCTFGEGNGYAYCRPYQSTTFVDCDFEEDFGLDVAQVAANALEFNDCTYAGEDFSEAGWKMFPNGAKVVVDGEAVEYKTYYEITDAAGLVAFRESVNSGDTTYNQPGLRIALGADIDLSDYDWSVNIGDDCNNTFDGIFDGQGHTIKNLTATETAQKGDVYICTGLFGAIYGDAKIMNLNIENVNIDVADFTGNNVGIVAGFAYSATGSIENVNVLGDVKVNAPGAYGVGSIIGYAYYGNPAIKNCSVTANDGSYIVAKSGVGGIIGYGCGTDVTGCSVENISITAEGLVGGIAGLNHRDSLITDCKVKDVALTATKAEWVNGAAAAVGSLVQTGTTIANITTSNVTVNGLASSKVAGSVYAEHPTEVVPAISAKIGDVYYATLQEAFDAAVDGDTVTIIGDVDMGTNRAVVKGKELIVDLNGHTITGSGNILLMVDLISGGGAASDADVAGKLTIIGEGTVENTGTDSRNSYAVYVGGGSELFVETGVTLKSVKGYATTLAPLGAGRASKLTLNGGTITGRYAISGNGAATDVSTVITINSGEVIGNDVGIYHPQFGTLNVNGGTISGNGDAAIAMRRGTAKITDGIIDGNVDILGDYAPVTASISGGDFTNATLKYTDGNVLEISGGIYATDVSDFVVPGFTLTENVDGTFGVASARALNVSAWKSAVVAGEEVTVAVTLDGEGLANVKWHLTYNPEHFELKNTNVKKITNADGTITIDAHNYLTGKGSYPVGTYWTYDFVAKAQREVVESDFVISETYAYTREESLEGTDVVALNNGKATVKINLKNYTVVAKFGNNEVVSGTSEEFAFDGIERRFVVTADPTATVKYTVNGVATDEVVVKDEGTYVINYTVVPELGFEGAEGTYTVTVNKADYVVEFVDNYVPNKTLVLVYTNTDNIFFSYDDELMINVEARGYTYNDGPNAHEHVFGFVTDGIANGTLADYEAGIEYFYGTGDFYTITAYNEDVNFDTDLDIRDITTVYTVLNAEDIVFSNVKYQKHILKSDLHVDKCVDGNDANIVVEKIYPTTTSN